MISQEELKNALMESYEELKPYSKRYRVDFDRYLFSLQVINNLKELETKRILDVGTGIGLIPFTLKKLGWNASGIDYYIFPQNNNEMFAFEDVDRLAKTWEKQNVEILNADFFGESLPWESNRFDVIISEATIEHLKDPKKLIDSVWTFLKPCGYFLVSTPNIATLQKRIRFLFGKTPNWPIEEFYKSGEEFTGHWREYTLQELIQMCEMVNFEIVDSYNKNLLASFKNFKSWKKNIRALLVKISGLIPGAREMNYVLCKKPR